MDRTSKTVRCDIESCAHCTPDHFCRLMTLHIGACGSSAPTRVKDRRESMCKSFERKVF